MQFYTNLIYILSNAYTVFNVHKHDFISLIFSFLYFIFKTYSALRIVTVSSES